jgi:hypothetical protein
VARQHTVRALVPAADERTIRRELEELSGAGVLHVDVRTPPPATYRDEQADRQFHNVWRASSGLLIVTALGGALIGAAVAFAVPGLREDLPWTAFLLAFGFAWGGAAFGWGRGAQLAKREDSLPDEQVRVEGRERLDLRLLTVELQQDREKVAEHLESRGATLLDSRHPIVGDTGSLARPSDAEGPTVPEGQRTGRDGHGGHVTRGRGSDRA